MKSLKLPNSINFEFPLRVSMRMLFTSSTLLYQIRI